MAIEGPISELALSDVFQLLDLSRKTGILSVRGEEPEHSARVGFEQGAVVSVELGESADRLGHRLVRAGKLTDMQLAEGLREQRTAGGAPLGEVLVRLGVVSETEVKRHLGFQIQEAVFELLRWTEGYFRFEEVKPRGETRMRVAIPTHALLMEAARRIDEWTLLERKIPHVGVVPRMVPNAKSDGGMIDLLPSEWEVLAEIDGRRTLQALATELGRSDFEVGKIVFGLVSTGIVEITEGTPVDPGKGERSSDVATEVVRIEAALRDRHFSLAWQMLEKLVPQHPERTDLQVLAARALGGLGRWRRAVEVLAYSVRQDPLSAPAHYQLGFAAVRAGDPARAEQAWSAFLRLPEAAGEQCETVRRALPAVATLRELLAAEDG